MLTMLAYDSIVHRAAYSLAVLMCALCLPVAASAQEMKTPGVRVEGVVLDQSGAPVPEAEVVLKAGSFAATQMTTNNGRFVFDPVPTKAGTLTIQARGFNAIQQSWNAHEGNVTGLQIVLVPASIAEQVTVTATRIETRLSETAASIVVLAPEELSSAAAVTLDDVLRQVPGFSLFRRTGSRTANPTSQGVSLRGVGASGASRAVVLADGIPLNDPFGGWVYWGRIPRESVNRIEVLRGGASSLYGSAALGGVVQLITRKIETPVLSFEASYGNQRTPDASLFVSGQRRGWGASLAAESFRTDGYILVDRRERGPIDTPASSRRAAVNLTLERKITEQARVFMRGSFFGEARMNGTPLQTNRTHIRQLIIGSDWQSPRVGAFSARTYGGTQVFDQNFSLVAANRNSETLTRVQRVPAQVTGLTSQWSRTFGGIHALVAGLEAREVRGASDEIAYISGQANSFVDSGGRERTIGVFLQDVIRLTSRLFLTPGARIDRWRNYDALQAMRPLSPPTSLTSVLLFKDRTERAFSPQLSVLYKLSDRISLNASATRAFRAPTLNELYRSFRVGDVMTLANADLRAERLTNGEAGANFTAFNRRLTTRGAFFWMEITRPIANVTLRTTPTLITRQRQNLGRTRSRGVEIETEARLAHHWDISGGYSFTDATVVRFPANTSLEGLLIPQVPRSIFTFQARYANPSIITLGLQGRASSAQFDDDQNLFRLGSFFTLDALVSRRVSREVDVFAAAENLFGERYDIGRTPVRTVGPPLLVRIGIRLHLGPQ